MASKGATRPLASALPRTAPRFASTRACLAHRFRCLVCAPTMRRRPRTRPHRATSPRAPCYAPRMPPANSDDSAYVARNWIDGGALAGPDGITRVRVDPVPLTEQCLTPSKAHPFQGCGQRAGHHGDAHDAAIDLNAPLVVAELQRRRAPPDIMPAPAISLDLTAPTFVLPPNRAPLPYMRTYAALCDDADLVPLGPLAARMPMPAPPCITWAWSPDPRTHNALPAIAAEHGACVCDVIPAEARPC